MTGINTYALPKGSWILVTGANGFVPSNIIDELLSLGYRVRGSTRTPMPWLDNYFQEKFGPQAYESVIVASFSDKGAISAAMQGVDGVIHAASDLTFSPDPESVIPWVVGATLNVLEAAQQHSVKRVVLVSSSSAADMMTPSAEKKVLHADSWNKDAFRLAWDKQTPSKSKGLAVYSASKTEGERQAWDWVKENSPAFTFNTVLPCLNVGRILHPEIFGSTMGWTRKLIQGDPTAFTMFPEQWFVDVQDTARLCAIGLLHPDVQSERVFAFGEQQNWNDIVGILRKVLPKCTLLCEGPENEGRDQMEIRPRERSESLLRDFYGQSGWTTIHDSLSRGTKDLSEV
ncbi:hypothetical protein FE257_007141 [Aspergillus nanangensis]|uniref:NAD-dependent epimerase/dehydratase domain-containing protein n=1 Tax=Aspergillus nanangensis TaxID=2582783 RepID=A0AAD4GVM8_ASPNN|nr:hypothetical protein FE257_007141 [Aspergillus nanangensis]